MPSPPTCSPPEDRAAPHHLTRRRLSAPGDGHDQREPGGREQRERPPPVGLSRSNCMPGRGRQQRRPDDDPGQDLDHHRRHPEPPEQVGQEGRDHCHREDDGQCSECLRIHSRPPAAHRTRRPPKPAMNGTVGGSALGGYREGNHLSPAGETGERSVRVRVIGPLLVYVDGRRARDLPAGRASSLLGLLAADAGRLVPDRSDHRGPVAREPAGQARAERRLAREPAPSAGRAGTASRAGGRATGSSCPTRSPPTSTTPRRRSSRPRTASPPVPRRRPRRPPARRSSCSTPASCWRTSCTRPGPKAPDAGPSGSSAGPAGACGPRRSSWRTPPPRCGRRRPRSRPTPSTRRRRGPSCGRTTAGGTGARPW